MSAPTTVYTSRATNWPVLAVGVGLAVPLLATGLSAAEPELLGPLAMVAAMVIGALMSTSLRVTAGTAGVTVRSGVLGVPRWTFPIDRIARVEPADLSVWTMVGGIWWSPRDGLRITQRTGPSLRLRLTDGRRVTLTVNEPQLAVAVLNEAMRARDDQGRA